MICEICTTNIAKHKHHIQSKSLGGDNSKANLCFLCPNCHHEVHSKDGIVLEGKFLTTSGYTLVYHKKGEKSITGRTPECFIFGKTV
jgi:5-methylcytosine-specific restriction endonuclease McrA